MQFTGTHEIAASRADVWSALNDPATFEQCIPGCERCMEVEPANYEVVLVAFVGPVRATFVATVTVSDHVPVESYRIEATGTGLTAGLGKLTAVVGLVDSQWGTTLNYSANARVHDTLAHLGSPAIHAAVRRFAEEFFAQLNALLSASDERSASWRPRD